MPITYADRGPSPFDVVESAAGVRDSTDGRWGAFSIDLRDAGMAGRQLAHQYRPGTVRRRLWGHP